MQQQPISYDFGSSYHSIFVKKNTNKLYSFGLNDYGQLGLGDTIRRYTPTLINYQFDGNPISIQLGLYHSLILTDTGKVYSFGDNRYGQLGLGDTIDRNTPTLINYQFDGKPVSIQQGYWHSTIITNIGKVYSFGNNGNGRLGLGDYNHRNTPTLINYQFDGIPIKLQLDQYHSLLLTDVGKVYSFGWNYYGELGLGNKTTKTSPTLINYQFNGNPIDIQQSDAQSMILTDTGKVYSFGLNRYGKLGLGDTIRRYTPTLINYQFDGKPVSIQQGDYHNLISTDNNKIYSFGLNQNGQLGLGNTTNKTTPTLINYSFNGTPIKIQQGRHHSLILTDTNKVYSFGLNSYGQLSLGDTTDRNTPTLIPNFEVALYLILYKLLLYKDNNYYYQNTDDGSINLLGSIISYEDFENYGIEDIDDIINIPDIINNNYSILQYHKNQTSSSNITSEITYIPNNQLIKMQEYIFTQDFSNIDKITLNQSNLNILNNELKNINEITKFIIPNYGIDNNLNLTYKNKEEQNTINELESGFYVKSYNINDIKQKYNNLVQFEN